MVFSKQKCKIKWEKNISTFGEAPICLCHFENSAFRVVLSFDRKHSLTASMLGMKTLELSRVGNLKNKFRLV